jgi:tetrahydromethanopterin S-methyltransferase subunit A
MVLKKKPTDPWPLITGEYHAGNPENPVAVCTCGSHLKADELLAAGASIVGPAKTENIGIEKMTANMVSNPNIRYLILCGMEVKGHITGQCMEAFLKDGIDKEGKIVGSTGAIPFIQNLNEESIERVRQQVQSVNMINVEDMGAIKAKIQELVSKDPGALDVEPMRIEISRGGEEEEAHGPRPLAAEVVEIRDRIRVQDYAITVDGLLNKLQAGIYELKMDGIALDLTIV